MIVNNHFETAPFDCIVILDEKPSLRILSDAHTQRVEKVPDTLSFTAPFFVEGSQQPLQHHAVGRSVGIAELLAVRDRWVTQLHVRRQIFFQLC